MEIPVPLHCAKSSVPHNPDSHLQNQYPRSAQFLPGIRIMLLLCSQPSLSLHKKPFWISAHRYSPLWLWILLYLLLSVHPHNRSDL